MTLKLNNFINMPHPMLETRSIGADATDVIKRTGFKAGKCAPHARGHVSAEYVLPHAPRS